MTAFGQYIRAARLGYYWSRRLNAWVRISDAPSGGWLVEVATHVEATDKSPTRLHRAWWEGANPEEAIRRAPALMRMQPLGAKEKRTLLLGDDGEEARP